MNIFQNAKVLNHQNLLMKIYFIYKATSDTLNLFMRFLIFQTQIISKMTNSKQFITKIIKYKEN
jgi:hypothetical protein